MPELPVVNLVFIGHIDHGKSTLIGRMLVEAGVISKTVLEKLEDETSKIGKGHAKFAWIMDRLKDERESDQTTDVSYRTFEAGKKLFTIIDAPGHRDFVRNMITGSSQADAAVLVVSAAPGQFESGIKPSNMSTGEIGGQTREHAILAFTLGIRQLVIAVNKMDTVDYSRERYQEIRTAIEGLLKEVGYSSPEQFLYVPVAAFHGENIARRGERMSWYQGPTLLEALATLKEPEKPVDKPLRIPVQRSFNVPGVGIVPAGRVETGVLKVGDEIVVIPTGAKGIVKSMQIFHRTVDRALPGDNVGINVRGMKREDVWKGCVIGHASSPPLATKRFRARIFVIEHPAGIRRGYQPSLFCHTDQTECRIDDIESALDPKTGEVIANQPEVLQKGMAGNVIISVVRQKPPTVVLDRVSDIPRLARFAIRDMGATVAVGMCTDYVT